MLGLNQKINPHQTFQKMGWIETFENPSSILVPGVEYSVGIGEPSLQRPNYDPDNFFGPRKSNDNPSIVSLRTQCRKSHDPILGLD
jgi:hypothetical protein